MWKKKKGRTMAAGMLLSLCLGWMPQQAAAAPVITNMPHKADGTRITGSQPAPKGMPQDVVVKPKTPQAEVSQPVTSGKAPVPAAQERPKAEAPKPVTPAVQAPPKTEAPKPVTPAVQAPPKAETPKPVTPAVQAPPKETVKADPASLPTKPPGWRTQKPKSENTAPAEQPKILRKNTKQETEKSVYQVGDRGWKVKQAQQYLQKLGFDPGGTDGQFTKSMRKALRKFQKKYNLKESGNLDNTTYQELKWQAEAKEYGGNVASTKILKTAAQYKGVPYVFGGTTPRGFDCSGYVQYVFAKHGVRLTRTADTQALEGKYVSRKGLRPGDLVFFTTYEPGASHVGIYAGNNRFWNATSSRGIMLSDLTDSYWGPRYYTARRILTEK